MSDRSAEDFARSSSDLQSQDGLHQHPGRRAAGGDAVSDSVPIKRVPAALPDPSPGNVMF